jgi:hypothetical protein
MEMLVVVVVLWWVVIVVGVGLLVLLIPVDRSVILPSNVLGV